jgi:hypothetical protein
MRLLVDLKERRGYSQLNEEALDRTMVRAHFKSLSFTKTVYLCGPCHSRDTELLSPSIGKRLKKDKGQPYLHQTY